MSRNRPSAAVSRALRIAARREARKQRAAKILSTTFGTSSVAPPAIDVVLMGKLRESLGQIDFDLLEACWQRGLLSSRLVEAIRMARFLSCTLPAARAAQSVTGIPASVLVAEAYLISGDCSGSNDVFATGRHFQSLTDAFINRANVLKNERAFKAAKRNGDVANSIAAHDLSECDALRNSL